MKRTIVATLMLAALGGCRMPDEGADMPVQRPPTSSRASRSSSSYYNQTAWQNKEDGDDNAETMPAPRRTTTASRPSTSRTTASASRAGCTSGSCRSDDDSLSLNDPATRDLIQSTMTRTGSGATARTASRSSVAQADSDSLPPTRSADYSPTFGRRPQALPAEMRAAPLERGASANTLSSGRLSQTSMTTPASLSRAAASKASGGKLSLVNTRRIHLRYALDRVVTASSSSIEVWGTRDMRTWKRYPLVADSGVRTAEGRSETGTGCLVEVEGEGVYGFTLCGTRGDAGSRAPQPGDVPQLWVAVDTTRPSVRLISSELQEQDSGRKVVVRWTAQDANLGERPITLSYAHKPAGPWTTIAGHLANSGHYEWALPAQVGSFLHLRVQAADLMGNVGTADAAHPLFVREQETAETHGSTGLPPAINTQSGVPTASAGELSQPELTGASGDDR